MTGEGPKYFENLSATQAETTKRAATAHFLLDLEKWAREISGTDNIDWLEKQLETCLPTWKIWREQNKSGATAETGAPIHQDQINRRVA